MALVSQRIVHKVHNQRVYTNATTWGKSDLPLRLLLATPTDTQDYQQAIRECKAAGMDCMAINLPDSNTFFNITNACAAAAIEGSFKIAPCLDMGSGATLVSKTAAQLSAALVPYLNHAQLDKDDGDRLVIWTFDGINKALSFWEDLSDNYLDVAGYESSFVIDVTPLASLVRAGTISQSTANARLQAYIDDSEDGKIYFYNFSPDVSPYIDTLMALVPDERRAFTVWPGYWRRIVNNQPAAIFVDSHGTQTLQDYIDDNDGKAPQFFPTFDDFTEMTVFEPSIKLGDIRSQVVAEDVTDEWVTYPMEVRPGATFNVEHLTSGSRTTSSFTAPSDGSVAFSLIAFGFTLQIGVASSPAKTLISQKATDLAVNPPTFVGGTATLNFDPSLVGGSITVWQGDTCVWNHKITSTVMTTSLAQSQQYRAIAVAPITGFSDTSIPQRTFFSLFFSMCRPPKPHSK